MESRLCPSKSETERTAFRLDANYSFGHITLDWVFALLQLRWIGRRFCILYFEAKAYDWNSESLLYFRLCHGIIVFSQPFGIPLVNLCHHMDLRLGQICQHSTRAAAGDLRLAGVQDR